MDWGLKYPNPSSIDRTGLQKIQIQRYTQSLMAQVDVKSQNLRTNINDWHLISWDKFGANLFHNALYCTRYLKWCLLKIHILKRFGANPWSICRPTPVEIRGGSSVHCWYGYFPFTTKWHFWHPYSWAGKNLLGLIRSNFFHSTVFSASSVLTSRLIIPQVPFIDYTASFFKNKISECGNIYLPETYDNVRSRLWTREKHILSGRANHDAQNVNENLRYGGTCGIMSLDVIW